MISPTVDRVSHTHGDLLVRQKNSSFFRLMFDLHNMCFDGEQIKETIL